MRKPSRFRRFLEDNPKIHYLVVYLLRLIAKYKKCVFCEIIRGESLRKLVYQDDLVTAFWDAHPATNTHILIVTNRHIESINDLQPEDELICGRMFTIAKKLSDRYGLQGDGYRLIINTGLHAGQTVFHIHLHLKSFT